MPRYRTLQQIDDAGWDIRLHCFACNHTRTIDGIYYMWFEHRSLSDELAHAQPYFRCEGCKGRGALILPATPARRRGTNPNEWAAGYFFRCRAAAKAAKRK